MSFVFECCNEGGGKALFFAAAVLLAATPGPGIFYVAACTLSGGRAEGVASSFGTDLGGLVHVSAGAVGVSALVLASAELFMALRGLKCPVPVIRAKRQLREMSPEQVLHLVCTDPMTQIDIPHMTHELGHALLSSEVRGEEFLFWLRRT